MEINTIDIALEAVYHGPKSDIWYQAPWFKGGLRAEF
jgi:hypothetical protein